MSAEKKAARKAEYDAMSKKGRRMLIISRVVVYFFLIFITVMCLFSFYLLIVNSSRSNQQLQSGFTPVPKEHFMDNLRNAWTGSGDSSAGTDTLKIQRGMLNSFFIAFATAILASYFSALTAYGIHCYDFKFKKAAFTFIMAIMMIPSQVSAVGFIKMCTKLQLTNKYLPLIIPAVASPVVFFYMKQYMESVLPLEIVEAARVDGSHEFSTFNRIVLPIMSPAIAVQMIFSFVGSWNNYFIPAMLIDDPKKATVPILIARLRSMDPTSADLGKVYMTILLAIMPVVIVYLILSKYIIGGVSEGSVKG